MMDLPESWSRIEITEVLEANNNGKTFQQGWSPRCENFPAPEGKWGVLKTTSIQYGEFWDHENKFLPDYLEPRAHLEVKPGDVLMTCAGPRVRCGVACLVERTRPKLMMSGKMYRFRPHPEVMHPKYLAYMIQTPEAQLEIDRMKTGINDSGLNLTHSRFAAWNVAVAPLNEQRRIVAKIEELFSELDKGIESLKTAGRQLEVYRQSVLKHAFAGKLTAQWREENKDKLEKPEQLLSHIKRERAAHYGRQLDEWKAAVKAWKEGDKTGTKPSKPKAQANIDGMAAEPPDLPEGWGCLRLDGIADVVGGITKNQTRSELPHKMKYLRVANVYADKILTDNVHEIGVTEAEARKVALEVGDLLVVEGNGSMDQIGRVAMWHGELPVCGHQNHLIRVRVANGSDPRFVLLFLLSPQGRDLIVEEASSTSGLHTLSISKVSNLVVPVTCPAEEAAVVAAVDEKLEGIDRAVEKIDIQLAKSEALRQAILKKAFSGQLVAHDPNDETVSVLLNRIREEKRQASKRDRARPHVHETKATA